MADLFFYEGWNRSLMALEKEWWLNDVMVEKCWFVLQIFLLTKAYATVPFQLTFFLIKKGLSLLLIIYVIKESWFWLIMIKLILINAVYNVYNGNLYSKLPGFILTEL